MNPVLTVPGSVLLKLRYDGPLSKFAFKFNLRRFTMDPARVAAACDDNTIGVVCILGNHYTGHYDPVHEIAAALAEMNRLTGRGVHSSTFQLDLSRFGHKMHPNTPAYPLIPSKHPLNNPYMHPLSHRKH
jgi:hypothetical protein